MILSRNAAGKRRAKAGDGPGLKGTSGGGAFEVHEASAADACCTNPSLLSSSIKREILPASAWGSDAFDKWSWHL